MNATLCLQSTHCTIDFVFSKVPLTFYGLEQYLFIRYKIKEVVCVVYILTMTSEREDTTETVLFLLLFLLFNSSVDSRAVISINPLYVLIFLPYIYAAIYFQLSVTNFSKVLSSPCSMRLIYCVYTVHIINVWYFGYEKAQHCQLYIMSSVDS